jgi:hypothetical protein
VTLPEVAMVTGSFSDDGLPSPPGRPTFQWTKVSGPGAVVFGDPASWVTTAAFGAPGDYVLRLAINDGAATAQDDVTVRVSGAPAPAPVIKSAGLSGSPSAEFRLVFESVPGTSYVVEVRASLTEGDWQTLAEVSAEAQSRAVVIADPWESARPSRFYRIRNQ